MIKLSCKQGKDKQAYVLFYFYVIKGPAMGLGVKKYASNGFFKVRDAVAKNKKSWRTY